MKREFKGIAVVDIQYPFELIDAEQYAGPVMVEVRGDDSLVSLEQRGFILVIKPQSSDQIAMGRNITQIGTVFNSSIIVSGDTDETPENRGTELPRLTLSYPEGVAVGRKNF